MDIAFCLDDNYVPHCAAVMASVMAQNEGEDITFHLLADRISDGNRQTLTRWIGGMQRRHIRIYDVPREDFSCFPIGEAYVNVTTYFRLAIPHYLKGVDKVLYMDCDVLAAAPLTELWRTDIADVAFAGVRDRMSDNIRLYNRLRYDRHYGYINAGVLLINVRRWREARVWERAKEVAGRMPLALKNHDQDILNILFHEEMRFVDFRWNVMEYFYYVEEWLCLDRRHYPTIIEACRRPAVIHFCMPTKPWHYECINPHRHLYSEYQKLTPWPHLPLTHKRVRLSRKERLKELLERLGLYHVERKPTLRRDIDVIEEPDNVLF